MKDRIYNEKNGLWYERQGDHYLPFLGLPEEKSVEIGIWGERRREFLRKKHRIVYYSLLTEDGLDRHLADVNERAEKMFDQLVKELSRQEGITEKLKAEDMMAWVRKTNNIRNRATEIVNEEVIFNIM